MNISERTRQENDSPVIVDITGRLDNQAAEEIPAFFEALFVQSCFKFIVDLSETDYVAVEALHRLVTVHKKCLENQGLLSIVVRSGSRAHESINMTGLDHCLQVSFSPEPQE